MSDERVELEKIDPQDDTALVRPHYPGVIGYPDVPAYGYGYGEEEEDGLHLRELWRTVRKRKWLIVAVAVIVTTLVTIEAYNQIYLSSVRIYRARQRHAYSSFSLDRHGYSGRCGPLLSSAHDQYKLVQRSEEHTSELQSLAYLVCRLLL